MTILSPQAGNSRAAVSIGSTIDSKSESRGAGLSVSFEAA